MAQRNSSKRPVRRITTSTLVAMLMLGSIIVVMQSATAVTVGLSASSTNVSTAGTVSLQMTVTYATDEHIPVIYNRLIIERTDVIPSAGAYVTEFRWVVNGDILNNFGCTGLSVVLSSTGLGGVSGYGNGNEVYKGLYSGYGYDANAGHGASGYSGTGPSSDDSIPNDSDIFSGYSPSSGDGYGYDLVNGQGTLTYDITFPATCLTTGISYRMTGEVTTDYYGFQSVFKNVAIGISTAGGGAGAAAPSATDGTTAPTGDTISLTATSVTPPTGAAAAWEVTVASAQSGDTLSITLPGTTLNGPIELLLTQDLTNAEVTIVSYTGDGYAGLAGSAAFPPGIMADGVIEITISTGGGTVGTITIPYKLAQLPSGANALQGVIMRLENGNWVPHGRMQFVQQGDGSWTAEGSAPCCSVFAVGFDTEPPTVDLTVPDGELTGLATLTATAADNLQLLRVEFFVDDQRVGSDTSAPYEFALDTATLTNGDHTFKAVAYDFVENSAESSEQRTTQNEQVTPPGEGGGRGWVLWLVVGLIVVALVVLVITFAGRKPKAP